MTARAVGACQCDALESGAASLRVLAPMRDHSTSVPQLGVPVRKPGGVEARSE
jgi:hypothetical protein